MCWLTFGLQHPPRVGRPACDRCRRRVRSLAARQLRARVRDRPDVHGVSEAIVEGREPHGGGARCPACATFQQGVGSSREILAPHLCNCPAASSAELSLCVARMLEVGATVLHVRSEWITHEAEQTRRDTLINAIRVMHAAVLRSRTMLTILDTCDADRELAYAFRNRGGIAIQSASGWLSEHSDA